MNTGKLAIVAAVLLAFNLTSFNVIAQETDDNGTMAAAGTPNEHITRAIFTSGVQGREPIDTITKLSNDKNQIYFFSELSNLGGQVVVHRWEYQGKPMGEVKFNVGGPRWRVWSSKTLLPQWTGEWRVSIIDGAGNKVGESSFNYTAPETKK